MEHNRDRERRDPLRRSKAQVVDQALHLGLYRTRTAALAMPRAALVAEVYAEIWRRARNAADR